MLKVNPLIRKTQSIIRFSVLFVAIILACFSLSDYLFAATPEEERENELLRDHISGLKRIITSQVDVKVQIARNLALVRRGSMSAEIFYKSLARLEMPRGKEARHMLNEVKKDIANALGAEGQARGGAVAAPGAAQRSGGGACDLCSGHHALYALGSAR